MGKRGEGVERGVFAETVKIPYKFCPKIRTISPTVRHGLNTSGSKSVVRRGGVPVFGAQTLLSSLAAPAYLVLNWAHFMTTKIVGIRVLQFVSGMKENFKLLMLACRKSLMKGLVRSEMALIFILKIVLSTSASLCNWRQCQGQHQF
jgi:hypothetical protein